MSLISQLFSETRPPAPKFTEGDLLDLSSKVYIVTGGASGIGKELCKMLYEKSATVYIAGRSQQNAEDAISWIKSEIPNATGQLKFLNLDLSDLSTIKSSAQAFLAQEKRLDVAWHNAGVMMPPSGSKSKQGYELQLGTNVIGPWLFQNFLTPLMQQTAALPGTPKNSVRVVWVSSSANTMSPNPGGINWSDINYESTSFYNIRGILTLGGRFETYGQSKAANIILGAEAVRRWSGSGVLSLSLNPGNLKTPLLRNAVNGLLFPILAFLLYEPYFGALTELFAGLSPQIDESHNGAYIIPWGRFGNPRSDIRQGYDENGPKLWDWIEEECKEFM